MDINFIFNAGNIWSLASYSCKTVLILALALAIYSLARRASASVRHAALSLVLLATALSPLWSTLLPRWAIVPVPQAAVSAMFPSAPAFDPTASRISDPPESNQPSAISAAPSRKENSAWWVTPVSTAYVFGLLIVITHTAAVLFWTRRLRRAAKKLSAEQKYVRVDAARAAAEMNVRRQVEILFSEKLTVPVVCGWFRPAILLPSDATTWSSSHLRSVFLHEMAHLKRRDELTTTFARLSIAWQWFNPLVWLVLERCNSERERACDDLVLTAGVPATDYADHLVVSARSAATRWLRPAGVAMDRTSDIEARLSDILD
ncbi:MAG: M56 family metallopeptidase, partial [candidate division Zixibacteria bacterium]|nr:M56 family metallopeptidase [candidate division Zixibacteria bacterium]